MKRYSVFQKHKRKGNMTWYGRISENGLFHVISLGTKKKADAIAWLDLMNAQKFLPEGFASDKPDAHLVELKNKFVDSIEVANSASDATVRAYQLRLSYFIDWTASRGKTLVSQVSDKDAVDFSTAIATKYAPKTASEILKLFLATHLQDHREPVRIRAPAEAQTHRKRLLDARGNQRHPGCSSEHGIPQVLGAHGLRRAPLFRGPRFALERRR